jgi:hypothetical protein
VGNLVDVQPAELVVRDAAVLMREVEASGERIERKDCGII